MVEMSFVSHFAIGNSLPDLGIICTVFFGLFFGSRIGIETGAAFGLIRDVMGHGFFGANMLIMAGLGFIAGMLSDKVYREHPITQGLFVFITVIVIAHGKSGTAVYSAFAAPLVFFLLTHIFETREISWIEYGGDD